MRSGAYVGVLWVRCSPKPATATGRCGSRAARSALVTTIAAPPLHGMTISSMCRGSAISGDASTSSTLTGRSKNTASGLAHALDPLIGDDLGPAALVPPEQLVVALRVQGEAAVLTEIAVRDVELGLRRPPRRARRAEPDTRVGRVGRRGEGSGLHGCRAQHDIADPQLDRRRRPPHHAHRAGATEVEALGEVERPAAVLGDRRGDEVRRLADVATAAEAVDLAGSIPASARASAARSAHCSRPSRGAPLKCRSGRRSTNPATTASPRSPAINGSEAGAATPRRWRCRRTSMPSPPRRRARRRRRRA